MKTIIKNLTVILLGVFLVSCNNNADYIKFTDDKAYVAFEKTSVSVSEETPTVEVSVFLSSIAGISETITVEAVDGTAKKE